MKDDLTNDQAQTYSMTREQAENTIRRWGEYLEVDVDGDDFADAVGALAMPVMRGRLDFDDEAETFRYRLIKPIRHTNSIKEIVEIREGSFRSNKVIDRYKENETIAQAQALIARRTNLDVAEVEDLCDRDIRNINAVILGFFAQTKSSR